MSFKLFGLGFVVKTVASLDDTISKVPVILAITKTRKGIIAFTIGNLFAVAVAIIVAKFLSDLILGSPVFRYITVGVIYLIAIFVTTEIIRQDRIKKRDTILIEKAQKALTFTQLLMIGFTVSLVTVFDDTAVFIPVLANNPSEQILAASGIMAATILELGLTILFAEQLQKFKYSRHIAVLALFILGTLFLLGVL